MTTTTRPAARWKAALATTLVVAAGLFTTATQAGPTLDKIKQRGSIKVGVGTTPGFFAPDSNGRWQGFFADYGRALSITVFGDPDKVEFTNSSPQQRLPALQAGEFDVLLSGVTVTITRAFQLGFHFGPTVFYDGQGILVRKDLGVTKAVDLDGATIGVQSGTTGELNIADFFRKTGKKFNPGHDRGHRRIHQRAGNVARRCHHAGFVRPCRQAHPTEEARRLHHPARAAVEGTTRTGDRQRRRPLAGNRQLDGQRNHPGRGMGHHQQECRRVPQVARSGHPALSRRRPVAWPGHRPRSEIRLQHHQDGGQLRRDLRPQPEAARLGARL